MSWPWPRDLWPVTFSRPLQARTAIQRKSSTRRQFCVGKPMVLLITVLKRHDERISDQPCVPNPSAIWTSDLCSKSFQVIQESVYFCLWLLEETRWSDSDGLTAFSCQDDMHTELSQSRIDIRVTWPDVRFFKLDLPGSANTCFGVSMRKTR